MPMYCCVYECQNGSDVHPNKHFHQFPTNDKLKNAWKKRVRREDFIPSQYSYVCSDHFLETDYSKLNPDTPPQFQRKRLKRGVIPSVNLRGTGDDEKIPRRYSLTSLKARAADKQSENDTENGSPSTSRAMLDIEDSSIEFKPDNGDNLKTMIQSLKEKLSLSESKNSLLEHEINNLRSSVFCYENLSPENVLAYTNISKENFDILYQYLERFQPISYWTGSPCISISSKDQLLICMMKLKLNVPFFDIARRYSTSRTTIQNIYMTYLHLLHEVLFESLHNQVPSVEKNLSCLPESFEFSNCRIIIDCTEFRIEKPRANLNTATLLYSNYKHNLTAKYLIGVAPNGAITFVSDGYLGSISDKVVTDDSGVLNHLKAGDLILADKGFLLHDILPQGLLLNLPAFLRGKQQFTKAEVIFSRKIARSRIHVERAIERMRNYNILEKIAAKERWFCDKIVQVCAALVNLQTPIIAGVFKDDESDIDLVISH